MKNNKGFTIIELILSISILIILFQCGYILFNGAKKTNKKASQIDMANAIALSKIEEMKSDPLKFYNKHKTGEEEYYDRDNKIIDSSEKKFNKDRFYDRLRKCANKAKLVQYYDKNGNLVKNKKDAEYTMFMKLRRVKDTKRTFSYNRDTYMYADQYTVPDDGDGEYFIMVAPSGAAATYSYDYYLLLLKKYDYKKFQRDYKAYKTNRMDPRGDLYILDNFAAQKYTYNYGDSSHNRLVRITMDSNKAKNTIPVRLDFSSLAHLNMYNVDIINLTDRDVDMYLFYDEGNDNKVNVNVKKGNVNVTRTSRRQRMEKTNYKIEVDVIRKENEKAYKKATEEEKRKLELIHFENEKYVPSENME